MSDFLPWEMSGSYLESCNCDAICPCRAIGGRKGGRSTHGICEGALSWRIEDGRAGEVDLSGLQVVMATRYDDDEPGSPWSFYLYLDEDASDGQREALAAIYQGHLGGTPLKQFPWAFKDSDLLEVRPARIEIDHAPGRGSFSIGDEVAVRVRGPFDSQETVTCVIPGHHQSGREVVAETLSVSAPPLELSHEGVCGYESRFSYSSDG